MAGQLLKTALHSRVGFEVIEEHVDSGRARYFGRVHPSRMPTWLSCMEKLLHAARRSDNPWSIDLSRQYFLRGDKMFWGWRIIIQGAQVATHFESISQIINSVQVVRRQMDTVPLHAPPNRNELRNGRGAQPMDSAVVGPLAKARLNQ